MKKSRGLLIALLALVVVASLGILAACGQQGGASSTSKESFSINSEPEQSLPPIELKTTPFYVLVVGNDSRTGTVEINKEAYKDGKGRSDTMMMVRVDPKNYKLTFVSIPRDTAVTYKGETHKINEMLEDEGIEGLKSAIKDLTGVDFDYYLMCTFSSFEQLVDDKGGLAADVRADQGMTDIVSGKYIEYPAGWYDALNGAESLVFARERHNYDPNGEVFRQSNDRYVVRCLIEQILQNPATAVEVATKMYGNLDTDWDSRELMAYVEDFMKNSDKITFLSGSGPWEGGEDPESGKWVTMRDEETWAKLIDVVNDGGDPNDVVSTLSLYDDIGSGFGGKSTSDDEKSKGSDDADNGEGEGNAEE